MAAREERAEQAGFGSLKCVGMTGSLEVARSGDEVLQSILQMTSSLLIVLAFALLVFGFLGQRRLQAATTTRSKGGHKVLAALVVVALSVLILLNPELVSLGFLGDAAFVDMLVVLIGVRFQALGAQVRSWVIAIFWPFIRWFKTPRVVYLGVLFCIAFENVISEIRAILHRISS